MEFLSWLNSAFVVKTGHIDLDTREHSECK